jgi:hypothetical protein
VDWVDPDEHSIDRQELFAYLIGDIVGIDRRLGVNAKRRQLFEDAVIAIILGICGSPRLAVATPENCDPIVFHIGHVVSMEVIATAIMLARITVRTASIATPQALRSRTEPAPA